MASDVAARSIKIANRSSWRTRVVLDCFPETPEIVYGFNITNLSAEFQCNAHCNTNQGLASVN